MISRAVQRPARRPFRRARHASWAISVAPRRCPISASASCASTPAAARSTSASRARRTPVSSPRRPRAPSSWRAWAAASSPIPTLGIETWFEPGKEVFVVHSGEEARDRYRYLLAHDAERQAAGRAARERVLKEHTFRHRAAQLREIVENSTFRDTYAKCQLHSPLRDIANLRGADRRCRSEFIRNRALQDM